MLRFSIVINTLNRSTLLQKTLESMQWLDYSGQFEVIVVNGPSTDETASLLETWAPRIRAASCGVANLSISRNIGISMASGDIVAFIDDDAIPEPEWLTQLAAAYDCDEVGGAGGVVFDSSGYTYQYKYSTANRLGNANWNAKASGDHLCFPGSYEFPYLQGTNSSFRRSALLEVGGFDEEVEYYLDETELCCRLVDAGYVIRQLPRAYVHHKFAPSHIRDQQNITRHRYPVLKNKIYFSLKHARPYLTLEEILEDGRNFIKNHAGEVEFYIAKGRLPADERNRFEDESNRAWERGVERGLSDEPKLMDRAKLAQQQGEFVPFPALAAADRKSIVVICRSLSLDHDGKASQGKDVAETLAHAGNIVHLITESSDVNRVDLENGVWIHRMLVRDIPPFPSALERRIPAHIWNWSATAFEECLRISTHRPIDVVEAPVWNCEGIAFLLQRKWPLVTNVATTLHLWLDTHPEYREDQAWMSTFGTPLLALEKELMSVSDAIRSMDGSTVEIPSQGVPLGHRCNGMANDAESRSLAVYDMAAARHRAHES
jgi:glycosyltransferase involved in cell wall biosynthesis